MEKHRVDGHPAARKRRCYPNPASGSATLKPNAVALGPAATEGLNEAARAHPASFTERVVTILQSHADPGPGDVNRVVRQALIGLWVPPDETELRPPRWHRVTPRGLEAGLLMAQTAASSRRKPRDPSSPGALPANWRCSGGRRAASSGRRPSVSGKQAVADAACAPIAAPCLFADQRLADGAPRRHEDLPPKLAASTQGHRWRDLFETRVQ